MTLPRIGSKAMALLAALAVLIVTSILVDRLGAPAELIMQSTLILALAGIAFAGSTTRTMRVSTFQSAGGRLGWFRSVSLSAGIGIGLALLGGGQSQALETATWIAGGLLVAALVFAGPLKRAGAAGLGAFALARYRSRILSIASGLIVTTVAGWLALRTGTLAVSAFGAFPGVDPHAARWIVAGLAIVMLLPGGMASLAASAVVVMLLASAGYLLPLAALASQGDGILVPAVNSAMVQIQSIVPTGDGLALALASAGLFAVLGVALTVPGPVRARHTHAVAALAVLVLALTAAVIASAVATTTAGLSNRSISQLPSSIYGQRAEGQVAICGVAPKDPAQLQRVCGPYLIGEALLPSAIVVRTPDGGRWMAIALDLSASLGAIATLGAPLLLTLLLAVLIRSATSGLIDDLLHPLFNRAGTASARLAQHRLVGVVAIIAATSGFVLPRAIEEPLTMAAVVTLTLWPIALLIPARFRSADWRTPLMLLVAIASLAGALATQRISTALWPLWLGAFGAAGCLCLLLLRSRDPADARAADIVSGQLAGPIVQHQDA